MITFIYSITNTSAAVTLLCLAAMPFITALLGFLFLKEGTKGLKAKAYKTKSGIVHTAEKSRERHIV